MTFGGIVLQVNTHRLTDSDFRFDVTLSIGGSHDAISRRTVLLPGEYPPGSARRYAAASASS